jgi:hypothetical protein
MNARWLRLLCAGALTLSSLTSLLAHAQYSWIDEKGSRVFSDRPPPPGTPASRILKSPGALAPAAPLPAASAGPDTGASASASTAKAAVPDWKQREEDYRQRSEVRAKEEAAERVATAKRRDERAAECEWARGAMTQLDRTRRLEWTNKQGKRELMSDEDRSAERARTQKILSSCG